MGRHLLFLRALNREERTKAGLLSAWFFTTVAALWLIKSVRVAELLIHFGAKETPYVRLAGVAAVAVTVAVYSVGVGRLSRIGIVRATSAAFALVLVAFWVTLHVGGEHVGATRAFVWAVYILADVYAVVMIELFWTYTNDVVSPTEANRLYGAIGLGGILGGVAGGAFVDVFTRMVGSANLLAVAAGVVTAGAAFASTAERVLRPPPRRTYDARAASALDGVREVLKSRYLLLLVGVVIAYEFTATLADYGVNVIFERAHLSEVELTRLYGRLAWIASAAAILAQVVIVPLVLPMKRMALLLPPLAMLASIVGVVVLPVLATVIIMATVDRGLNYSVQQATRESLYVPLSDVQKYKAKAFIDMFVDRAAKALASLVLLVLIAVSKDSVRLPLIVGCVSALVWIGSARRLGNSSSTTHRVP